jgi:predicted N-acetyltransferase YhbS
MMVTIGSLTPDDWEALAKLYEELSNIDAEEDKMKENLSWIVANEDYYLIGAKNENGELVGSLLGIVCRDIVGNCRPFMVLENVIVTEKSRGQGIGGKLLKWIEDKAHERNCHYIMFVSSIQRKGAHKFYETLGYKLDVV